MINLYEMRKEKEPEPKYIKLYFDHLQEFQNIHFNPVLKAILKRTTNASEGQVIYTADEIKQLLDKTRDDPMHMVILLASYYGLRRSEAVGLKWSAIDFTANTISIRHKVLQDKDGVQSYDVMKTKSSHRTLPLIPFVREEMLKEKARQEEMKVLMKKGYNHEYDEYICVDAIGNIITPNYVSTHFQIILKTLGMRKI